MQQKIKTSPIRSHVCILHPKNLRRVRLLHGITAVLLPFGFCSLSILPWSHDAQTSASHLWRENIQKTTCTITQSSKLEVMFWLDKEWGMQSCHFSCYPSIGPFSQRLHWIISQNQPHTSLTSTISDNFFLVSFQICILSFPEVKPVRSHWSVSSYLRLPLDHPNESNASTCPLSRHPNMLRHFIHMLCYHDFREFPSIQELQGLHMPNYNHWYYWILECIAWCSHIPTHPSTSLSFSLSKSSNYNLFRGKGMERRIKGTHCNVVCLQHFHD